LAWQEGQSTAVFRITTPERGLGATIVRLILEELSFSQRWKALHEQLTGAVPTSQES